MVGLAKDQIIQYIPRKKTPFLTFVQERVETERVVLGKEAYDDRRDRYISREKSVLYYEKEESICRNQILLAYFGEKNTSPCGKCDICLKKRESNLSNDDFENIRLVIQQLLTEEELSVKEFERLYEIISEDFVCITGYFGKTKMTFIDSVYFERKSMMGFWTEIFQYESKDRQVPCIKVNDNGVLFFNIENEKIIRIFEYNIEVNIDRNKLTKWTE